MVGPDPAGCIPIPAPDAGHKRMSAACGRRIVDMVWEDLTPDQIMTPANAKRGYCCDGRRLFYKSHSPNCDVTPCGCRPDLG